ncbi:histidine kinase [Streptomyces sp. NPDC051561]|uniref:sensor histidine kinase n=1 Tax=Streptomyces sp. NPDC051561 TaxID=3365658 RepID=UPI003794EC02
MTKTQSRMSGSPEAELLKRMVANLREDLLRDPLAYRPLAPLSTDRPVARALPGPLRTFVSRLPHGLVLLTAVITFIVAFTYAGTDAADLQFLFIGLVCAGAVALTLVRPMAAWWLSVLAVPFARVVDPGAGGGPWVPATAVMQLAVIAVVTARTRARTAAQMWVCLLLLAVVLNPTSQHPNSAPMLVGSGVLLLLVSVVRIRLDATREVVAQKSVTAVERERRTLLEERTTIARELHDVVAHHMSVVAIQAEAAQYRVENPPPELQAAFVTIRENAVAALTELRRVLGVVRAADYEAPDAPQPTLDDLPKLVANVRDAGLEVEHVTTGAVRALPQGVELSAYRIVQEALSNVLRHAPGARARVEVSHVLGGLGLRVINGPATGEARPSAGSGHGLTGMRERIGMLNGEMTAEATADGGFEVTVFVPVQGGGAAAHGSDPVQGSAPATGSAPAKVSVPVQGSVPAQARGAESPVPAAPATLGGPAPIDLTKDSAS